MSFYRYNSIFNPSKVLKIHFCLMEPKFLLYTDFSDILNFKAFSVAPSIINEKEQNVLFH